MTLWLGEKFNRLLHRFNRLDEPPPSPWWNVRAARVTPPGTNAEKMWTCPQRQKRAGSTQNLASLDRMVGFASRGLPVPSEPKKSFFARGLHLGSSS